MVSLRNAWLVALLVVLNGGALAHADEAATKEQADEILAELKKVRALLEESSHLGVQQNTRTVRIPVGTSPFLGSKEASVAIVELMDYECPYCRQFYRQTFADLKSQFIDTNRVRFFISNLPLEIHSNALTSAEAGVCAADQGRFWELHDLMQKSSEPLTLDQVSELAEKAGLAVPDIRHCIASKDTVEKVQRATNEITSQGIHATPAFVVGTIRNGVLEGDLVLGAVPLGVFQQKINQFAKRTQ